MGMSSFVKTIVTINYVVSPVKFPQSRSYEPEEMLQPTGEIPQMHIVNEDSLYSARFFCVLVRAQPEHLPTLVLPFLVPGLTLPKGPISFLAVKTVS